MAKKNSRGATRLPVRKERQAIEWKKWLRSGMLLSILLAAIAIGINLRHTTVFPTEVLPILHVTVEGDFLHVNNDDLVNAVTPYATGGFMDVDVARLGAAGEALPWVKVVQVKRIWPDSLHLVVEEQVAIAQWGDDALVNSEGDLFFPAKDSFPRDLAQLKGPTGSNHKVAMRFYEVSQLVSKLGLSVQQVEMSERQAWSIKFKNGLDVLLGRINSEQRLQRFITAYTSVFQPYKNEITTVDMRYTNGLSVAWATGMKPDFNGTI